MPHFTLPSESESLQTTNSPRLHHPGFDPLVPASSSGFLSLLSKASLSIDGHRTRGPFTFMMPVPSSSNPASPAWSSALVRSRRRRVSKVHSSYGGGRGPCPALQPSYWLLPCSQSPLRPYQRCHSHRTPPQLTLPVFLWPLTTLLKSLTSRPLGTSLWPNPESLSCLHLSQLAGNYSCSEFFLS